MTVRSSQERATFPSLPFYWYAAFGACMPCCCSLRGCFAAGLDVEMYVSSPKISHHNALMDLLVHYNHDSWWKEAHGQLPYHVIDSLRVVASLVTQQKARYWQDLVGNCVLCSGSVCDGVSLSVSLNQTLRGFLVQWHHMAVQMPLISAPRIGNLASLVRAIPTLQKDLLTMVIFKHTLASKGCSDPFLNFAYVANLIANMNAQTQLVLSKMYVIIIMHQMNASPKLMVSAAFDGAGIWCLVKEYCSGTQELAKRLLDQLSIETDSDRLHVAEIGTNMGYWSLGLVEHFSNLIMLAVDPYNRSHDGYPETELAYDSLHAKAAPVRSRYVQIHQMSEEASRWVGNSCLDLVYIDGKHTYEACISDVQHWEPKLKDRGRLMFHDYHFFYPGVVRCIHEAFERFGAGSIFFGLDSVAHFRLNRQDRKSVV